MFNRFSLSRHQQLHWRSPPLQGGAPRYRAAPRFAGALQPRSELNSPPTVNAEVLCGAVLDNKNPRFPGIFLLLEPSDGLEPSTPSLPWRFWGGTGGHGRALAITFFLQFCTLRSVLRVSACPRVPAHARAGVPVSYPCAVVSFPNRKRRSVRPGVSTSWSCLPLPPSEGPWRRAGADDVGAPRKIAL